MFKSIDHIYNDSPEAFKVSNALLFKLEDDQFIKTIVYSEPEHFFIIRNYYVAGRCKEAVEVVLEEYIKRGDVSRNMALLYKYWYEHPELQNWAYNWFQLDYSNYINFPEKKFNLYGRCIDNGLKRLNYAKPISKFIGLSD